MNALAPLALGMLVFALLGYAAFAGSRRMMRAGADVRLFDALKLRGIMPSAPQDYAAVRAAAQATRRCLACAEQHSCDARLATGSWQAVREICPNTAYIESLRQ